MNEAPINAIVEQFVRKLSGELGKLPSAVAPARAPAIITKRPGVFDDLDSATSSAQRAQEQWVRLDVETREKVIEAMRQCTRDNVNDLSRMAVEETKLGNVADKVKTFLGLMLDKKPRE
jgi:acyl-CoA reductase-like NAD-dependent aldehyde dehydrogenase